jgi:hypothetical protein
MPSLFLAGVCLGLLPLLRQWGDLSWPTALFRGLALPTLCGLALWGLYGGLAWALGRRSDGASAEPKVESWSGRAQAWRTDVSLWRNGLARRWPLALVALALAALALLCQARQEQARAGLLAFHQQHALAGQQGFLASYYLEGDWFTPASHQAVETAVNHDDQRDELFRRERLHGRWCALLDLKAPRVLELATTSDDGSLLLVDGRRVVDNLGVRPAKAARGTIALAAGPHALELLYFQAGGRASLRLDLPEGLAEGLTPVDPAGAERELFGRDRQVEWWRGRMVALLGLAGALLCLGLWPYPRAWPTALAGWLAKRWPHLAILGATAAVMAYRLGSAPGLEGDEAWAGATAFGYHWYGIWPDHPTLTYCNIYDGVYPVMLLQQLFPLDTALLRTAPIFFDLLGVLMAGLGLERLLGRRAGLWALLLLGSSAWFLCLSRTAQESNIYSLFCAGAMVLGLAAARGAARGAKREGWWGAPLAGLAAGLGLVNHMMFLPLVAATSLMILAEGRLALLRAGRAWAGVLALAAGSFYAVWRLFAREGFNDQGGVATSLGVLGERLWDYLTWLLPTTLSGWRLAIEFGGEAPWPALPLVPLILGLMLVAWAWLPRDAAHRVALRRLGLVAGLCLALTVVVTPQLKVKYLEPFLFVLLLWAAAFVSGMELEGGLARRVGRAAAALLAAAGLYAYLGNCLGGFARHGGLPYLIPEAQRKPGEYQATLHQMDARGLYLALAARGKPVYVSNYMLAQTLLFHESSDGLGHRGLVLVEPERAELAVYYTVTDYTRLKFRILPQQFHDLFKAHTGHGPRAIHLGEGLDNKFAVFAIPPGLFPAS